MTTGVRRALPALVGVLLVVCAGLVIVGVAIERGGETDTHTGEVVESGEHVEAGHHDPAAEATHAEAGESAMVEALESPAALAGLAVVSIGLAVLVWRRPIRAVVAAVVVVAVVAGVFDVIEFGRHLSGDRIGLALLAGSIAVLRVATVVGALLLWRPATE
jgi:hypothetical protein